MASGDVVSRARGQRAYNGMTTEGRVEAHASCREGERNGNSPRLSYMRCVRSSVARFCGG